MTPEGGRYSSFALSTFSAAIHRSEKKACRLSVCNGRFTKAGRLRRRAPRRMNSLARATKGHLHLGRNPNRLGNHPAGGVEYATVYHA